MEPELISSNKVVLAIASGEAPRPAQLAAAKGILPLPQTDLLEALVLLSRKDDDELAATAKETLSGQAPEALLEILDSEAAPPLVLDYFAKDSSAGAAIAESVISNRKTPAASIVALAKTTRNPEALDLISLNQQLLISEPAIIEAVLGNPNRSAEAERRLKETRKEFFEKERGAEQVARELRAQGKEAAAEFIEAAEFGKGLDNGSVSEEDALFIAGFIEVPDSEVDDSWLSLEYIEEIYEETDAQRRAVAESIISEIRADAGEIAHERISMIHKIMQMNMRDRMKLAMKGDREARTILIRDPNKIISSAVVQNPKITEQEIEKAASMRSINQDVLRMISINRNWARNYKIIHILCLNPRTPLANVMGFLPRLQPKDLMAISKNRNVPEAVRKNAARLISARAGR